ncbi:PAS domain-containing hybrid sensor histidine kinase/response regulator [Shewanella sp. GutDb-MelDb]|uniref:PAS domain-containing hybrid sensor histidine kinase/response regulator n=1 Tax=Shewanella sp. GutDb-MelDb TaxID=2058316 RepID=UPI000C7D41B4|nr:PAS domain-containing hybrid sensor histidine kinase/response regulator [Shewanella sp. GutDb-MelDb]PKG56892.1 hybrid sensor histidine kinase/response regulator [Shewanella sp. GutDb-MelDb]
MISLSYKTRSSWLVVFATLILIVIAMQLAKVNIVQKYQYAYTELSHDILSVRDDVFKIEVTNGQDYDVISNALVGTERQVQLLQVSLQPENISVISYLLLGDPEIVLHANQLSASVAALVTDLETTLRLKISQEYSKHTINLLQQDLWQKMPDNDNRIHVIGQIMALPISTIVSPELASLSSYQSLSIHTALLATIKQQISVKNHQILNGKVREDISEQEFFWLSIVEKTKLNLLFSSMLLIVILSLYYRVQLQEQTRKERSMLQSLTASEKEKDLLALVAEHAQDGFIITDKQGLVTWVNKGFTTISGYTLDDIQGKKPGDVLQGSNTSKEDVGKISSAIRGHESIEAEIVNYHKDGSPYWIDMSINAVTDSHGEVSNFIAVERDTTARKQMQDDLAQAVVKADVSNRAKSTFLATMSHELRTPLNGILGMAQIIEPNLDNPEHRKQIQILLESGNHLTSLLNDILDFSKVEQGRLELENEVFNFNSVLDPITNTYEPICGEKNIQLVVTNDIEEGQSFKGDKARIRQVIYNLLSNSVKFTKEGSVSLAFKQGINIEGALGVEIKISDTGIGIRQERLASIFDPFTQAESSTTRQYGGTGLGLSIVKQLVELMNGTISITSEVGKGTFFAVFIAIERAKAKPKAAVVTESAHNHLPESINILIAEDNKINALVARTFCQRLGHTVDVAKNGLEATQMVQQKHYDLVVMDNHMPEMDGIEATQYIRDELKLDIPIFACTADVFQQAHDNMIRAGANHVLTKPLQEQSFRDALSQHAHIICKTYLSHEISKTNNSDNKVVALARHKEEDLNITEADIDFKQLLALYDDNHTKIEEEVELFKMFAESSISQLIHAYDTNDVKEIHALAHSVQNMAANFYAPRLHNLAKEIAAITVMDVIPKLESLQHLINFLEVNIHQNQRFISRKINQDKSNQAI